MFDIIELFAAAIISAHRHELPASFCNNCHFDDCKLCMRYSSHPISQQHLYGFVSLPEHGQLFDCYRTSVCINNQCFGTHQPSGRTKARTSSSPSVRTAYDLEASQSSVLKFQEDRHQVRCVETDVFSGRSVQSCEEALQQRQRSNRCFRAIGPSISCAYFCLQEFHMCCQGALTHLEKHQLLRSGINPLCVQAVTRLTCKSSLQEGVETAESTDKGMSTLDTEHEKYSKWSRNIARCVSPSPPFVVPIAAT